MPKSSIGVYQDASGTWHVDKVFKGRRIRASFGTDRETAERWLASQLERLRRATWYGERSPRTLEEAACRYLEENQRKVSIQDDVFLLRPVIAMIGHLYLHQVHDGTLRQFVEARLESGVKHKTVNLALSVVRRILNLASRAWRDENGLTWLETPPLLTLLPLDDARDPRPITWEEQRALLPLLPDHLARMILFTLNTGARDEAVCGLRWAWEIRIPETGLSVFEVPRNSVKGRRGARYLVLNSVAQSVIESARGQDDVYVFPYRGHRVGTMNNTAWQRARDLAGLRGVRIHDLRHTVGMRLRERGAREETIADLLWHARRSTTAIYTVAQVRELVEALESIATDAGTKNRSLRMLRGAV